jgi:leader peptidase (prepilin peptidase)/N-methyltransferase
VQFGRVLLVVALSLPAGWFSTVLIDRGATDRPFLRPMLHPLQGATGRPRALGVHLTVTFVATVLAIRLDTASIMMLLALLGLVTVLIALAMIDLATYRLPDRIVLPALCVSIVWISIDALVGGNSEQIRAALAGSGVYFAILFLAHLVSPRGMGFGDVKLAALMGLFLGAVTGTTLDAVVLVLWAMIVGFTIGTFAGLAILIRRRANRPFPFGPFLVVGTLVALLMSPSILG